MPQTPHVERHFTGGETVRDVVIGMSDGLTVPFALAAGLSGAVASAQVSVRPRDSPLRVLPSRGALLATGSYVSQCRLGWMAHHSG